ncbi:DUF2310 family Zn-ribbon-containing protein [Hahella sp. HN01]|uniref:DUF2310 family Zn-ribbon-containing protein n=1 Tax=Hahella sp. HN01 TaxID=2847262 RepID=UPI00352FF9A4
MLYKISFRPDASRDFDMTEAKEVFENYLAAMLKNGQIFGDYYIVSQNGALHAYANLQGAQAMHRKHHSQFGLDCLAKINALFGTHPHWECLEDMQEEEFDWRTSSSLILATDMFAEGASLRREGDGKGVPLYHLPVSDEVRENIYRWNLSYQAHDQLWIDSGSLEIPAYKEMTDVNSELSEMGREYCRLIELATDLPTYYFLYRYWGRGQDEAHRKCPGCGGRWRTSEPLDGRREYWLFPFKCDPCRLVSGAGVEMDDDDLALIGEWTGR